MELLLYVHLTKLQKARFHWHCGITEDWEQTGVLVKQANGLLAFRHSDLMSEMNC